MDKTLGRAYIAEHIAIHRSRALGLLRDYLVELSHALLKGLQDMGLELCKAILHCQHILAIVVLFDNLFVEAMVYLPLEDVGVFGSFHRASVGIVSSSMLSQQLDMLL